MTAMGTAVQATPPTTWVVSAFTPTMPQVPMGAATLVSLTGTTPTAKTSGQGWPRGDWS